jgi:hypothetical protein
MSKSITILSGILLGLTLTTTASASPFDAPMQLVLPSLDTRSATTQTETDTQLAPALYQPTSLTPTLLSTWTTSESDAYPVHLESGAPEGLAITVRLSNVVSVYVSADLDSQLSSRPDAIHGETYFSVGASFDVTHQLQLFVEDFQPASAIVGDELREPAPLFFWDGHQFTAGVRYAQDNWSLEAGTVVYALSTSNRDSGVGARVSLTIRF